MALIASLLVPFATEDEHRQRAWDWLRPRYELAELEIIEGRSTSPAGWSKATALADALSRASGDVLIVADADVWAPDLARAVDAVERGLASWAVPHLRVHRLTAAATRHVIAGELELEACRSWDERPYVGIPGGGIVVLTRELYDEIPLDRRFVGWGGEDNAWGYALQTIAGMPLRCSGPLWHLWHPPQQRPNRARGSADNERLRIEYRRAAVRADVDRMRDLVAGGR